MDRPVFPHRLTSTDAAFNNKVNWPDWNTFFVSLPASFQTHVHFKLKSSDWVWHGHPTNASTRKSVYDAFQLPYTLRHSCQGQTQTRAGRGDGVGGERDWERDRESRDWGRREREMQNGYVREWPFLQQPIFMSWYCYQCITPWIATPPTITPLNRQSIIIGQRGALTLTSYGALGCNWLHS